jgi:hypothetical protein
MQEKVNAVNETFPTKKGRLGTWWDGKRQPVERNYEEPGR